MIRDRFALVERAIHFETPPPPKVRGLKQAKVKPGNPIQFWFLNSTVLWVPVHFDREEKRTYPCGRDHCWANHKQGMPNWQGWIGVYSPRDDKARMFCVTPGLAEMFPEFKDKNASLRGKSFRAWRDGNYKNAPLAGCYEPIHVTRKLPAAPDVWWNLKHMWTAETPQEAEAPQCHYMLS